MATASGARPRAGIWWCMALWAVGGICVAMLLFAVPGCSQLVYFDVYGVVKDAADGTRLGGVEISLKTRSTKEPTPYGESVVVEPSGRITTDGEGTFALKIRKLDQAIISSEPEWVLSLSKPGYEPESVDISPDPKRLPGSERDPGRIRIIVYMRPAKPKSG